MKLHQHQWCSIVPPQILTKLSENPEHRESALRALIDSERVRGRREAFSLFQPTALPTGVKRRTIYDAKQESGLPGTLVRGEGDIESSDVAVNEAYDFSGSTFDFYQDVLERNSIDDQGMRLDSTVHYLQDFDNAFWDGRQMIYGDGDGRVFQRFTKCIDVVAHELTHGVTAFVAGLEYFDQHGALNESMSDVFGSLVKQFSRKQTADEADWLIGEGLFTDQINGKAIRSMKEPGTAYDDPIIGKDLQPGHMKDYQQVDFDHGGVHINSGIPNRAFYITAIEIGGFAWERAGQIWYSALSKLSARSDFVAAANATYAAAGELFNEGSREQDAVRKGWSEVGIEMVAAMAVVAGSGRSSAKPPARVGRLPQRKKAS